MATLLLIIAVLLFPAVFAFGLRVIWEIFKIGVVLVFSALVLMIVFA